MSLEPYPPISVTWRQTERRQQFVPGLGIDDGVSQLGVGPAALSPEMGCIQPKAGNLAFHDPYCSSGIGSQSQGAHDIAPITGRRHCIPYLVIRTPTCR